MNIALINKETNICENIAVFETIEIAQEMLGKQYNLTEQIKSHGIGDIYKDGTWSHVEPIVDPKTPTEQREEAYTSLTHKSDGTPLIEWEGQVITVDISNKKWLDYSAEGSTIANELSALIVTAKAYIRELYPDGGNDV